MDSWLIVAAGQVIENDGLRIDIMPCDVYLKLESEYKSASQKYAQFTFEENRGIRGVSNTKAKELAREARARETAITQQMGDHRQNCETCKAIDAK
jgi:hypothetical protein